jgi:hypothetical protein
MKRFLPFVLIAAFLFPTWGRVFAATATVDDSSQTPATTTIDLSSPQIQGLTVAAKQKAMTKDLLDIYTQLNTFSAQTQVTIGQISTNELDTSKAQADLLAATTALVKAKADIIAFSDISTTKNSALLTLDTLKYTANTTENTLIVAKTHILASLNDLKALLPVLDTSSQS